MKNRFEVKGKDILVFCNLAGENKEVAVIVDQKGFKIMDSHKTTWYALLTGRTNKIPYVYGSFKSKKHLLHRVLMNPGNGEYVDHINRNTLDNRFSNLRNVNAQENARNRKSYGMSGVKNVKWNKERRKWEVRLTINGKPKLFGAFDLIDDAEKAAIAARKENGYLE